MFNHWKKYKKTSEWIRSFWICCLQHVPNERDSFTMVLHHPYNLTQQAFPRILNWGQAVTTDRSFLTRHVGWILPIWETGFFLHRHLWGTSIKFHADPTSQQNSTTSFHWQHYFLTSTELRRFDVCTCNCGSTPLRRRSGTVPCIRQSHLKAEENKFAEFSSDNPEEGMCPLVLWFLWLFQHLSTTTFTTKHAQLPEKFPWINIKSYMPNANNRS